jgi:5-methylcytosine-specific restriction endonuclease McrA
VSYKINIMLKKENSISADYSYKYRMITYTFKCSNCDNNIKCQQSHLKTHSGKCRSCVQKKKPYEHIYNELKYRCLNRTNIEFTISFEYFINLIKNNKCHYCNSKLIFSKYTRDKDKQYTSRAHQLDRKDSNNGYVEDNLVTCCWECNRLKSNRFSYNEFMQLSPILIKIMENRNCTNIASPDKASAQ